MRAAMPAARIDWRKISVHSFVMPERSGAIVGYYTLSAHALLLPEIWQMGPQQRIRSESWATLPGPNTPAHLLLTRIRRQAFQ
jgi:hypothetical protein